MIDTSTGGPVPVSIDTTTATIAANRDYAQPVYAVLRADRPFLSASSGYAGTGSDGLHQLDASHRLPQTWSTARGGNVVQTAQVDVRAGKAFTLALGFGNTQRTAVRTAGATASSSWSRTYAQYAAGWLRRPRRSRRRSPASRRPAGSPRRTGTPPARASTAPRPTTTSATSRRGP